MTQEIATWLKPDLRRDRTEYGRPQIRIAALDDLLGRLRAADASIDRLLGTNSDQRHS